MTYLDGNQFDGWDLAIDLRVNGVQQSLPEQFSVQVSPRTSGQVIRTLFVGAYNGFPTSQPNDWVAVGIAGVARVDRAERDSGNGYLILNLDSVGQIGAPSQLASITSHAVGLLKTSLNAGNGNAYVDVRTLPFPGFEARIEGIEIAGALFGSIVSHRQIERISVGGTVGGPGSHATIRSQTHEIGSIDCAGNIHAHIETGNAGVGPGDYRIRRVRSTNGSFFGSLVADDFWGWFPSPTGGGVRGLYLEAPGARLEADVFLKSYAGTPPTGPAPELRLREIPAGRSLRFRQSLYTPVTILGPNLKGQIVVNAVNFGFSWSAPVTVDGVTLAPMPNYSNLSAGLGGGAVGVVPFNLHKQDCSPPDGGMVGWPGAYSVTVRHYGPVVIENSASDVTPMTVEWFNPNSQQWEDISGDFAYARSATNPRDVIVTSLIPNLDFDGAVTYRIRPRTTGANRLLCDPGVLAVSHAVPVAPYTYTIIGQEP
ncbi:MAG: hypothetical protein FJ255_12205 [Phycisphaerae bacterium]|nr:hypothetical protein [Phycisphaerae bacterium]